MDKFPAPSDHGEWQPATSRPGELFTVEGQMESIGAFARGLKRKDPRLRQYRRSMRRQALVVVAVAVAVVVVSVIAAAVG
jgi:hypothetical protein